MPYLHQNYVRVILVTCSDVIPWSENTRNADGEVALKRVTYISCFMQWIVLIQILSTFVITSSIHDASVYFYYYYSLILSASHNQRWTWPCSKYLWFSWVATLFVDSAQFLLNSLLGLCSLSPLLPCLPVCLFYPFLFLVVFLTSIILISTSLHSTYFQLHFVIIISKLFPPNAVKKIHESIILTHPMNKAPNTFPNHSHFGTTFDTIATT